MKLIISAGGTGGHIFPGIAVAQALARREKKENAVFIGTTRGMEGKIIPPLGFRLFFVDARQFLGRNPLYKMATLAHLLRGIRTSMKIIRNERPDAILGMGGFTSVPVIIAGVILGIPSFLHEQNAEPGLANRLLSRYAKAVFVSFEESKNRLAGKKIIYAGNPVRKTLRTSGGEKRDNDFTVFVFGGSRGARSINNGVASLLPFFGGGDRVVFYHQTGAEDYGRIRESYEKSTVRHEVFPFTDEMDRYYNLADVVISRAGASTIFELACFKKAAILIPYPHSAGGHQLKNATAVEKLGGCFVVNDEEATGAKLFGILKHLMGEPALLKEMGGNMGELYVEESEELIIDTMEREIAGVAA